MDVLPVWLPARHAVSPPPSGSDGDELVRRDRLAWIAQALPPACMMF
jgi:hypothetical protein